MVPAAVGRRGEVSVDPLLHDCLHQLRHGRWLEGIERVFAVRGADGQSRCLATQAGSKVHQLTAPLGPATPASTFLD